MGTRRTELPLRILGVDPGTLRTGWGVVERRGRTVQFCGGGVIHPKGFHSLPERLRVIYTCLAEIISQWTPHVLSIEKAFVAYNVQSAFRLGEARGVVLLAAAQAGLRIAEYNPTEIKTAVVGYGRADKLQVQKAVFALLNENLNRTAFAGLTSKDATDALAAALCHVNSSKFAERMRMADLPRRGAAGQETEAQKLLRSAFVRRSLPRSLPVR